MKFIYVLIFISSALAEPETSNIIDLKEFDLKEFDLEEFANVVNINNDVDSLIPQISQFLVQNGLDPLKLPQVVKKFSMEDTPLFSYQNTSTQSSQGLIKGNIVLDSGILKHLSNLKRYGDAILNREDQFLTLDIGFEFNFLEASYNFAGKIFFFPLRGSILASTENVRVKFSVTINKANMSLTLNKLELEIPSKIKVIIKNKKGRVDRIKTFLAKFIVPHYKNTLKNIVQKEGAKAIQSYLDKIKDQIPHENLEFSNKEQ